MRKICIINQKGGVGKTTTAANIAYGLAQRSRNVLVIDLDPQGNLSQYFPLTENKKDIYSVLIESADPHDCIHEVSPNLHVIAGRETLTKAELMMAGEPGRETIMRRKLMALQGYDYIIVDCAPSLGLLNQNALLYCNEAFIPVSTDYFGIEALKNILGAVTTINEVFDHDMEITKVIPTMFDARVKHCKECLAKIQNEFYEAATLPIRMNSKLKEAPKHAKSIFEHDKRSNGAKDYDQLVSHVIQGEDGEFVPQTHEATKLTA